MQPLRIGQVRVGGNHFRQGNAKALADGEQRISLVHPVDRSAGAGNGAGNTGWQADNLAHLEAVRVNAGVAGKQVLDGGGKARRQAKEAVARPNGIESAAGTAGNL